MGWLFSSKKDDAYDEEMENLKTRRIRNEISEREYEEEKEDIKKVYNDE